MAQDTSSVHIESYFFGSVR